MQLEDVFRRPIDGRNTDTAASKERDRWFSMTAESWAWMQNSFKN